MNELDILKYRVNAILERSVQGFCKERSIDHSLVKYKLEYSREDKFGDYSTAFALENKKIFNENPVAIAERMVEIIKAHSQDEFFEFINVTKPAFINFRISSSYLIEYISKTILQMDLYPRINDPENIIFEYVSANPTGPLNIVSARSAAMGDAIVRMLKIIGHKVHSEFYVNDYGNQVFLLGVACLFRLREMRGEISSYSEPDNNLTIEEMLEKNILPTESYRGDYIIDIVKNLLADENKNKILEELLSAKKYFALAEILSAWAVEFNLNTQKNDLLKFGIIFDDYFKERNLHDNGSVVAVLDELKKNNDIIKQDGKEVFISTKYGDDKDRVVVREDGRPTYLLADIAYHQDKIKRGYTRIYNIWGPDHHGYIARLKGAVQSLGFLPENFNVIIAQQVNLIANGEKIKMSKRLGQIQTMKDLFIFLGENYKDVGRYFFLMRTLDAPLDFDLDLAKDHSEKNPVYYLQYAHARICSIFREIGENFSVEALANLEMTEERSRLIFWLARFPEEALDAAKSMEPHRFINYLQNLSHAFSRFYIQKENRLKDSKLPIKLGLSTICKATQICLKEGISLFGISTPEKMSMEEKSLQ